MGSDDCRDEPARGMNRYKVTAEIELAEEAVARDEGHAWAKVRSLVTHSVPNLNIKRFDVEEIPDHD